MANKIVPRLETDCLWIKQHGFTARKSSSKHQLFSDLFLLPLIQFILQHNFLHCKKKVSFKSFLHITDHRYVSCHCSHCFENCEILKMHSDIYFKVWAWGDLKFCFCNFMWITKGEKKNHTKVVNFLHSDKSGFNFHLTDTDFRIFADIH